MNDREHWMEYIDVVIKSPRSGEYNETSFAKKLRSVFELIYLFDKLPMPLFWNPIEEDGKVYGLEITKHEGLHLLPARNIDSIVAIVSEQAYEISYCKPEKMESNGEGIRIRTDEWCSKIIIEKVKLYYGK